MREKCPYSELFWFAFPHIWTEYGEIFRICPYSVRMQENAEDNNSEDGHFLRSEMFDRDLNMRLCEQWEKAAIWKMRISRKAARLMSCLDDFKLSENTDKGSLIY